MLSIGSFSFNFYSGLGFSSWGLNSSWYQPAIDALTLSLMRQFNAIDRERTSPQQPLVYGTFQAYLRRLVSFCCSLFS